MKMMYMISLLLIFSGCKSDFAIKDIECESIHVEVYGDIKEEITLACGSEFKDLLDAICIDESIDTSIYNLHMPLYDGDRIELSKFKEHRISINTATKEELMTLKGIGEKTALRIIEYRETNGVFINLEAIMNVKGIGPKKYETIKEYICL